MPRCRGQAGRRRYQKKYESQGQRPNPFSELFGSGGRSVNWRDWFRWRNGWRGHRLASLSAENNVFILSGLDQCELLAVMDNRVQSDGKWTAYTPDRNGHSNLSDGSDVEELLLTDEQVIVATDWSRGGKTLLYLRGPT